jgi:hypothetical protein
LRMGCQRSERCTVALSREEGRRGGSIAIDLSVTSAVALRHSHRSRPLACVSMLPGCFRSEARQLSMVQTPEPAKLVGTAAHPGARLAGGENMRISDEECIRVRTDVWLQIGEDAPIKVQTRKLCLDGVFLEYTGRISGRSVDVIFPDGGDPALAGNSHVSGTVTWRWPDGVWIGFDRSLRSVSELLMRNSLAVPPAGTHTRLVGFGI